MSINDYFQTGEVKPKAKNTSGGITNYFKANTTSTPVPEQKKTPKQVQVETINLDKPKKEGVVSKTLSKIGNFFDTPENKGEAGTTTASQFPSQLAEHLPFIGGIIKEIHDQTAQGIYTPPKAIDMVKALPKATLETAKSFVTAPLGYVATFQGVGAQAMDALGINPKVDGAVSQNAQGEVRWQIPFLGEVRSVQARIADDYAYKPKPTGVMKGLETAKYTAEEMLNGLFFASMVRAPFVPRTKVIAEIKQSPESYSKTGEIFPKPKSFREYQTPSISTKTVYTAMNEDIATQLSKTTGKKITYTQGDPFFYRLTTKGGKTVGQVVQIRPSYFDTLFGKGFKAEVGKPMVINPIVESKVPESEIKVITTTEIPTQELANIKTGGAPATDTITMPTSMPSIHDQKTSSEIRNEIVNLQKDPVNNSQNIIDLQVAQREFYDLGAQESLAIKDLDGTPLATIKTFEYSDDKYAVQIEASTPSTGLNTSFENSKLYDSEKQAIVEAKKEVIAWANDALKRSVTPEDTLALNKIIQDIINPPKPKKVTQENQEVVDNKVDNVKQRTETATKLGEKAFIEGKKSTPSADKELMKLMEGLEVGEGTPIMEAWSKAWHKANLAPKKVTEKVLEKKLKKVLPSSKKKVELEMRPSNVVIKDALKNDLIVRKTEIKNLLQNSPEFKANPVFVVDDKLQLVFTSPKTTFKIKARAMNLDTVNIKEGDVIQVDVESLKEKGAPQQMRVFKDGVPMYQRMTQDIESFINEKETRAELAKYFDEGDLGITFSKQILMEDGGEAWGKYHKGMIEFVNNPLAKTPTHEAVHAFLDLFVSPEQKTKYLAEALKQDLNKIGKKEQDKNIRELHKQYAGTYSGAVIKRMYAEELLAEGFVEHRFRNNAKGFLRTWYDKIMAFLRRLFKSNSAEKLYEDITSKKRDYVKKEMGNQRELVNYANISKAEKAKNALALLKKQREITSKFFESPNIKGKESTSYTYLKDLSKSTGLGLKAQETKIIQETLESPEFKDKKVINLNDFKREVIGNMLPLSIIKTNTYANYGADNIGQGSADNITYLFNSTFEHGRTGHFPSDFELIINKDGIEIKEIPVQPQNPTVKYAVVRKGVTLTEENVEENVLDVSDSKEKAEKWIELHTSPDTNRIGLTKGLFGHVRVFDEKYDDSKVSSIAEIQSDVFQKLNNLQLTNSRIEQKKKEIAEWQEEVDRRTKLLPDEDLDRIAELKNRIEQNTRELSEIKPEIVPKEEQLFLGYKNVWHERMIREMINLKANQGFSSLRFPMPRTVAVIEGYSAGEDSDNVMPYELTGGMTRDDKLTFGDEIEMGGESYTVLSDDSYEIIVAPSTAVTHFDADDAMTEDIENRWDEEVRYTFEKGDLQRDFGDITTAEEAQRVIDSIAIYDKQVDFLSREKEINKEKEYLLNRLASSQDKNGIDDRLKKKIKDKNDYLKFQEIVNGAEFEKSKLTFENLSDISFKDKLEKKFGIGHGFWNYVLDGYRDRNYNPVPDISKKDVLKYVNGKIDNQLREIEGNIKDLQAEKLEATTSSNMRVADIDSRKAPTKKELDSLPKSLKDLLARNKDNQWKYSIDYSAEKILEKMAGKDPEENFTFEDFRDDAIEEMTNNYDADYEGIYGKDHVFYQDKGRGNQEVWTIDEGAYTESFSQPDQYEEAKSIEDFSIDDYNGNELTVLKFYEQQVNKYVAKLRKDNLETVRDDNGYEWLETKLTDADKEAPTAYMPKTPAEIKKEQDDLINSLKPIEIPEMIRIARALTGASPKIKTKMGNMLGYFRGAGEGEIALRADLFKAGNEVQVAKTLAHEIGHLGDWTPDKTLSRGNLLGRIFSLRKFMSSTFDKGLDTSLNLDELRNKAFKEILAEKGIKYGKYLTEKALRNELKPIIKKRFNEKIDETKAIRNPVVDAELTKVSEFWRPYDKTKVSASHRKYRNSSKEKYADTISMLFNKPDLLKEMAPVFYEEFFKALDRKPEFKANYFEMQALLNGSTEDLFKARKEDIRKGFAKAEELQNEMAEKRNNISRGKLWEMVRTAFEDENYSAIKAQDQSIKAGKTIADEDNVRFLLQEQKFVDNENFLLTKDVYENVLKPVEDAGMTKEDIGEYLLLKRIAGQINPSELPDLLKDLGKFYEINEGRLGGRADIANPLGFNLKTALEQLQFLEQTLGEKNFNLLEEKVQEFHNILFKSAEEAVRVGTYSKSVFEEKVKPNKENYAYFQVIKHLEEYISGGMEHQKGTFEDVSNPFVSTLIKTISLNRLNAKQRTKNAMVKELLTNHPQDIQPTRVKDIVAGRKLFENPRSGTKSLMVLSDGKMESWDIDPYIADVFTRTPNRELQAIMQVLSIPNNKIFKPLFTTFNPAFVLWNNLWRDFFQNWKSIPSLKSKGLFKDEILFKDLLQAYLSSLKEARNYSKGNLDTFTRALIEQKGIVSPINNYHYDPREEDDLSRTLERYHIIKRTDKESTEISRVRNKMLKPFIAISDFMQGLSQTLDIASKMAGAKVRMKYGEEGKQLAHNLRNYTGTPNYKVSGSWNAVTNEIFLFSRVMVQGMKSQAELATNPNTKYGYWVKTVKGDILPKIIMAILAGTVLKEFYDDISEYDKANYIVVPLGWYYTDTKSFGALGVGDGTPENRKAVYLRIPHSEFGRLVASTFWKTMNVIVKGDPQGIKDILAIGGGVLPSVSPAIEIPKAWGQAYIMNKNPYDAFRGRNIIDDTTWTAGGAEKLKKMFEWTANSTGMVKIATFDTSKNTGIETFMQTAPFFSSVVKISNYGQQEKLTKTTAEAVSKQAKETLRDREIVSKYVDLARENKSLLFASTKYRTDIIKEGLGGHMPKTAQEQEYADNLMLKFKRQLKYGKNDDPRVTKLIGATNLVKREILTSLKKDMTPAEYLKFRQGLVMDGIITPELSFSVK